MTGERTDFCVVGGGPAGLTAALLLARSGAKVTVVERSTSLEREYRGEILQPGGQALLAGLGVLDGARARGCHEHDRFLLEEHGRVLINGDYRRLPGPYNCLLSIPQRHLLAELLEHCHREQQFSYLGGAKVTGLVRDDDRIRGVVCRTAAGEQTVHAHCVVGADGRFSKVRQLAGIENERRDHFAQDVLWFRLRNRGDAPRDVRIFRAGGNPLLAYASVPDRIQLGWTLPHHGYRDLAARGLGYVKERLRAAVPATRIRSTPR
ncbi:FAD-dependent oxidoreductase [Amycolatopsis sp. WGS_07]|uniref:FAD-dependent oxidoreductase n=1 Tax=Amycolatopsis sp. WGS_07 TaxID=3076764 RepID=UPI0038734DF9